MPRRPVPPPISETIEQYSLKLFRLLLEYDRDDEGNFRTDVHNYFEACIREVERDAEVAALRKALYCDKEQILKRIEEILYPTDSNSKSESTKIRVVEKLDE